MNIIFAHYRYIVMRRKIIINFQQTPGEQSCLGQKNLLNNSNFKINNNFILKTSSLKFKKNNNNGNINKE